MSKEALKALIKKLGDALIEANNHLDYCGWGDSWERECAIPIMGHVETAAESYVQYKKDHKL